MGLNEQTLYSNAGNSSVLQYITEDDRAILDIGCGAGDLGKAIRSLYSSTQVVGITSSRVEYPIAQSNLNGCYLADVEKDQIPSLPFEEFDVIIFSHVLEHLVDPVKVIKKLLPYLKIGGKVIIAVPNIANWRDRWKLALGQFEYTESGVMDKTHLRFYTFHTAPRYLIEALKN
ncbi:MAG: methyltransferase domain-containing protein [Cyanobacteria bacterium]|jgi:2-polyprenyl-3-methyl-5-hydroxy-6-metoxy-1,4-benzoquinol methylase|nr:methyltransferase domain-containing protein [Cyanobacteria bacterium GSL.Bin1]